MSPRSPVSSHRVRAFVASEVASALLVVLAALAALIWVNSPLRGSYERWWTTGAGSIGSIHFDLRHWVNDGLMAVFFLVVGLEIGAELTRGHLSSARAALAPAVAAVGGMIAPALIYLAIAGSSAPSGWAIPIATDIALALGVVALAGDRVTPGQRAFLLALAIVDDIGAIVVIAVVYADGVQPAWLAAAAVVISAQVAAARYCPPRVVSTAVLALGIALWLVFLHAGIHPTVAGVVTGLVLCRSSRLTDLLRPWSSRLAVPVFALANSGVTLGLDTVTDAATSPVTWGVIGGLLIGKPIGIGLATRLASRGAPPSHDHAPGAGIGLAAAVGFTVALLITDLALDSPEQQAEARVGVLMASAIAGLSALLVLRRSARGPRERRGSAATAAGRGSRTRQVQRQ